MSCAFRSAVISASIFCLVVVKLFLAKPASVRHLVDITHLLPSVFSARRIVEVVVDIAVGVAVEVAVASS
jgi:hypothetical protein